MYIEYKTIFNLGSVEHSILKIDYCCKMMEAVKPNFHGVVIVQGTQANFCPYCGKGIVCVETERVG